MDAELTCDFFMQLILSCDLHFESCLDTCLPIEVLHGLQQEDELNYSHKVGALAVIQHQKTLILSSCLPSSLFLHASLLGQ